MPGDDSATAGPRRELSALEEALRQALATAPREEVVKSIAAIMPVGIDWLKARGCTAERYEK